MASVEAERTSSPRVSRGGIVRGRARTPWGSSPARTVTGPSNPRLSAAIGIARAPDRGTVRCPRSAAIVRPFRTGSTSIR